MDFVRLNLLFSSLLVLGEGRAAEANQGAHTIATHIFVDQCEHLMRLTCRVVSHRPAGSCVSGYLHCSVVLAPSKKVSVTQKNGKHAHPRLVNKSTGNEMQPHRLRADTSLWEKNCTQLCLLQHCLFSDEKILRADNFSSFLAFSSARIRLVDL